jgi:type I restriction enzyme R subunit
VPFNEADTRANLIDPALAKCGWTADHIRREKTKARVEIDTVEGKAKRRGDGRVDYLLRYRVNPGTQPVALALIEAKAESKTPGHGLQQAKDYRDRHNVPFVFSSNGHLFVEYDDFTGLTADAKPLSQFPTPEVLRARFEAGKGFRLDAPEAKPLLTPYRGGEGQRRYYQDAAIRAVFEKMARGEKRALLTLATGTGKTFIATNLLHRIAEAGQLTRALFLCDRDELRKQGLLAMTSQFGSDAAEVYRRNGRNNAANARVHVATYQTLGVDTDADTASFLREFYPENYFSHIVIDECHRSAWNQWFQVLERNPDAVHIGLTATPRKLDIEASGDEVEEDRRRIADNVAYFGEPVYSYDIAQGIEDGYLAACEIVRRDVFIEEQAQHEAVTGLARKELANKKLTYRHSGEAVGVDSAKPHYDAGQFESEITIPERTRRMAQDLFDNLLATGGPEQKTIIFCHRDDHAGDTATALNNIYAKWCSDNGQKRAANFAFKCTAEAGGQSLIPDFKGAPKSHFIACTVDLLSTGVDVPSLRNVVFFRYMKSPISFYQMLGRGTRIDEATGKLMFRVYDYTDATRLLGDEFKSRAPTVDKPTAPPVTNGDDGDDDDPLPSVIVIEGLSVRIEDAGRYVLMQQDGRDIRMPIEEYREKLAVELRAEAPDADTFRQIWIEPPRRRTLIDSLLEKGFAPRVIQHVDGLLAYDEYDVLASSAYHATPRTRDDRAARFALDNRSWLDGIPTDSKAVILALTQQFARGGTEELETREVLQTPAVARVGGLAALKKLGEPAGVLRETRERLFAA